MAITITGTIEVQDNNGQNHIIDADDMDFDVVESDEGSMGDKNTYQGIYEEGSLTVTVDVEEYSSGAYNGHEIEVEGGKLVNDNLEFHNNGMTEYQKLMNDGWEENGTIQCAIHGGDHEATILVDPNNPENLKYVCSQDGDIYE